MSKILSVHIPEIVRNYIINGNLDFWQRIETATVTVNTATTTTTYAADRFFYNSSGSTVKNYSVVQSSNVPTLPNSGVLSNLSYQFTMVTGIGSFASNDLVQPFCTKIEGFNYERLHSKTVTFSFWFYATIAGTYNFSLNNSAGTRSYVTTFTQSNATTWQFQTITLTLDSSSNSGSYNFTNGTGLQVNIGGFSGSSGQTSSTNQWNASLFQSATGSTNWMATSSNLINVAQLSLVEGSLGPGPFGFFRAAENVQAELAMCERYYQKSYEIGTAVGATTGGQSQASGNVFYCAARTDSTFNQHYNFRGPLRATPTLAIYDFAGASNKAFLNGANNGTVGATSVCTKSHTVTLNTTDSSYSGWHWTADADL